MDAEALERLLLDQALGVLPPDVQALLAAHLAHDPAAAARAREFAAATDLARQSLRWDVAGELPPFPAERIRSLERARGRLATIRKVASIAAAVVLGVGLGATLFRPYQPRASQPLVVGRAVPLGAMAVARTVAPDADSGGFWSAERLYERAQLNRRTKSDRLIWDSVVGRPRLGGSL